jgi:hypothetical protein
MLAPEFLLDIGGAIPIPELLKEIKKPGGIGLSGEYTGYYKAPPPQLPDNELRIGHRDVGIAYCIPQDTGFEIKSGASVRNTIAVPDPSLADGILFGFLFRGDSGKIPPRFFIFEGDIVIRPPSAGEDGEGKDHNKHLSTASGWGYMPVMCHFEK